MQNNTYEVSSLYRSHTKRPLKITNASSMWNRMKMFFISSSLIKTVLLALWWYYFVKGPKYILIKFQIVLEFHHIMHPFIKYVTENISF